MKKKKQNSTRNFILLILSIFFLAGITYAGTTISNNQAGYLVSDNVTINNSGAFYGGSKAFTKTADVVVCRGENPADDLKKSFECDIVCKSTDSDCLSIIQNKVDFLNTEEGGIMYFDKGIYNLSGRINITGMHNIWFRGAGKNQTIFTSNGFKCFESQNCSNIKWTDMGFDLKGNKWNAINVGDQCDDCVIDNVRAENADGAFLITGRWCGCRVTNSEFIKETQTISSDVATITNNCDYKWLLVEGNYFKFGSGVANGSGLLTNGGSINLIINNNYFLEQGSNTAYGCISMEGQVYDMRNIIISNNICESEDTGIGGSGAGIAVSNSGTYPREIENINIFGNIINGGDIKITNSNQSTNPSRELKIHNNIIRYGSSGIYVRCNNGSATINNNDLRDYNIQNSTFTSDKALRMEQCIDSLISNNKITKISQITNNVPYGIRLINSYNTTIIGNTFIGLNNSLRYTFSGSYNYYIDDYKYSTLPTCELNNVFDDKEIIYTADGYQKCLCVNNVWTCNVFNTSYWNLNSTTLKIGSKINFDIPTGRLTLGSTNYLSYELSLYGAAPALFFNETDQTYPAGNYRIDVQGDLLRIIRGSGIIYNINSTEAKFSGNIVSKNVLSLTDLGNSLGSSTLRWLKLWVKDIDVSGNVTMSNNDTICMNINCANYLKFNGTCIRAYGTNQVGGCL